jgi:geranylgeranyl diphosphate synthase type II
MTVASSSPTFVADGTGTATFDSSVVAEIDAYRTRVDEALALVCREDLTPLESGAPDVAAAIRYSLLGGGKRFRGILFLAAYQAAGGDADATTLAAAIEIVHAYSLIHDDLPCMDDDDVRRGRPTAHRVYGARTATVAGVTMVPLAARTAARGAKSLGTTEVPRIVAELMSAAGAGGMIGGQLLDLQAEGKPLGLPHLERIHRGKTGALVSAAALLGGLAAAASEQAVIALGRYGAALGLAFQIADDVLDVTGTTEGLGKTAGRDVALRKSTYPSLLGVEGATIRATALVDDGCAALASVTLLTPVLASIARFVVRRTS